MHYFDKQLQDVTWRMLLGDHDVGYADVHAIGHVVSNVEHGAGHADVHTVCHVVSNDVGHAATRPAVDHADEHAVCCGVWPCPLTMSLSASFPGIAHAFGHLVLS